MKRASKTVQIANARRARKDIALGKTLRIGQRWRDRTDGSVWQVRQVHRLDCAVDLRNEDTAARLLLRFADLRLDFDQLVAAEAA